MVREILIKILIKFLKKEFIPFIDFAISATDSKDEYSHGMRNGMRYVRALLTEEEPIFEKAESEE